jgi:hypothetical protein
MLNCKIQHITEIKRKTIFINPKCGHTQEFEYSSPFRCQDHSCFEEIPKIDKLYGCLNQDSRVKFYIEGKI